MSDNDPENKENELDPNSQLEKRTLQNLGFYKLGGVSAPQEHKRSRRSPRLQQSNAVRRPLSGTNLSLTGCPLDNIAIAPPHSMSGDMSQKNA
ncbi:MAG: hypothetical protein JXQ89_08215 [Pelagimonas sp.]